MRAINQRAFGALIALCLGAAISACGTDSADEPQAEPSAGAEQGGAEQGGAEQGGAEQGGAEQGGAEQGGAEQGGAEQESVWGQVCTESSECQAPTDFCVKQPNQTEGYCTYACTNNAECSDLEAPSDWSCNTLGFAGCEDIPSNWCGPASEITMFEGVIIECP